MAYIQRGHLPAALSLITITLLVFARTPAASARYDYGPPDLKEVCEAQICHRYGKIAAPLDHADPSQDEWELTYFVNSDYWNPLGERASLQSPAPAAVALFLGSNHLTVALNATPAFSQLRQTLQFSSTWAMGRRTWVGGLLRG